MYRFMYVYNNNNTNIVKDNNHNNENIGGQEQGLGPGLLQEAAEVFASGYIHMFIYIYIYT